MKNFKFQGVLYSKLYLTYEIVYLVKLNNVTVKKLYNDLNMKKLEVWPSFERCIKYFLSDNNIVLSKQTTNKLDLTDVFIRYDKKEERLTLEIMPDSFQIVFSFIFIMLSIFIFIQEKYFISQWIPFLGILIYYLYLKWLVYYEFGRVRNDLERRLNLQGVNFEVKSN